MKKQRQRISAAIVCAMLLINSQGVIAYAQEVKTSKQEQSSDTTPPVLDVSSLKVDKTELISGERVNISFKATDDMSGINDARIVYHKPISGGYQTILMKYNSKTDSYEGYMDIQNTTESGNWKIQRISLTDKSGNSKYTYNSNTDEYGELADLSAGDFKVLETESDVTAPVLDISTIKIEKNEVQAGERVKLSLKVADDLSGVNHVDVTYYKPISGSYGSILMKYNESTDLYEGYMDINENTESGLWKIKKIYMSDKSGNSKYVFNSNTDKYGELLDLSGGDFTVLETPGDITAPVLDVSSIKVDKRHVQTGEKAKISLKVTDDMSGVNHVSITYYKPITGNYQTVLTTYNQSTGLYEGYMNVDENTETGVWKINKIYISDKSGNSKYIYNSNTDQYGELADLSGGDFTAIKVVQDTTAPTFDVNTFKLNKNTFEAGDTLKVSLRASDDMSGIKNIHIVYRTPDNREETITLYENKTDQGLYEGSKFILRDTASGEWKVKYISLTDNKNNSTKIYDNTENSFIKEDLSSGNFTVKEYAYDTTAPKLDVNSIKIDKKEVNPGDTVKLTLKATDDISGIKSINVKYNTPVNNQVKSIDMIFNSNTNLYEGEILINKGMDLGSWSIWYIKLIDNNNNEVMIGNSKLNGNFDEKADLTAADFISTDKVILSKAQQEAVDKFRQFYLYGDMNNPTIDLSNTKSLIKTYSQATSMLKKKEDGKTYDRQRFLTAWSKLTDEEKSTPEMLKVQNEYYRMINMLEAAQSSLKFYEDVKNNAESIMLDVNLAKSLNNKDNMELGARGKAVKEYSDMSKYKETPSNSARMKYINEKYADTVNFLYIVEDLANNDLKAAKARVAKIGDSKLKTVAENRIKESGFTNNQLKAIETFKQFYMYKDLNGNSINLCDKNAKIETVKDAKLILTKQSGGTKYNRQIFLDAWSNLTTEEKAHTEMKKMQNEYKNIITIAQASEAVLSFYEGVSSNADKLIKDSSQAIKLNSKENMDLGARGKAVKEYSKLSSYNETTANSVRMKYLNEKYMDTVYFLQVSEYLGKGDKAAAKKSANKIVDNKLRDVALKNTK